jgi:hypothetical protein
LSPLTSELIKVLTLSVNPSRRKIGVGFEKNCSGWKFPHTAVLDVVVVRVAIVRLHSLPSAQRHGWLRLRLRLWLLLLLLLLLFRLLLFFLFFFFLLWNAVVALVITWAWLRSSNLSPPFPSQYFSSISIVIRKVCVVVFVCLHFQTIVSDCWANMFVDLNVFKN